MKDATFSTRLAKAIQDRGLTKQAVADLCGIKYHALNSILIRENAIPNAQIANQISKGLGVSLDWLLTGRDVDPYPIAVAGRVGAGARVPLVDAYEKGDGLYHVARPPQLAASSIVAVEVEGDSMSPMYQPGHVLFFSRGTYEGIPTEDIGRPCVVEDATGMAWVKQVRRGSEPGLWNLLSLNPHAESVWDVPIRWAARVLLALPPEFVQRIEPEG